MNEAVVVRGLTVDGDERSSVDDVDNDDEDERGTCSSKAESRELRSVVSDFLRSVSI